MSDNIKSLGDQLVNLTVKEVNELAGYLKSEYGIEPAAAAAVAGPAVAAVAEVVAEKTEFDVILQSPGANKLNVVKEVKNLLGLGLKEAKDLVDASPSTLKSGISKDDANNIKTVLETAGAQVEIK